MRDGRDVMLIQRINVIRNKAGFNEIRQAQTKDAKVVRKYLCNSLKIQPSEAS